MSIYRGIVHYHFKKGNEEEGIKKLETELFKAAHAFDNHQFELCFNEKDSCHVIGIAWWNSFDEAQEFQEEWHAKEKEILRLCTQEPRREFFKLRKSLFEKAKRSA